MCGQCVVCASSVDMQLTGFKEEEGKSHGQHEAGRRCREEVQSGGAERGCLWGDAVMRCSEEV